MKIEDAIALQILVLDGATGTMIQKYNLKEADFRGDRFLDHNINLQGCNDILCITKPEVVKAIHQQYLEAGANILETNSFNANRISMIDYGLENLCYDINLAAAQRARLAIDEYILEHPSHLAWVAGSMGPTNRSASISPDVENPGARNVTFDQLVEAYAEQASGLIDGGADVLLVETIFDTLNCKAALYAIEEVFEKNNHRLPVMISVTLSDIGGRTLSGQTLDAFVASVLHSRPFSIGLNCSFGPEQLIPFVKQLSTMIPCYLSVHPNAGLPDEMGNYHQSAEDMGAFAKQYASEGWINIMGGCCGTQPQHIKAIAEALKKFPPRKLPVLPRLTRVAGLETVTVTPENNFITVGERTNVAGSRKFARLIRERDFDQALSIAKNQVINGAQIIDVCMDDAMLESKSAMVEFLNLVASDPDISKAPIMIDSSDWQVITAGLRCCQGKCIVNSISLKEGEEQLIEKASELRKMGAAAVVMLFDEEGQAVDFQRRIQIAKRSYEILTQRVGFFPEDIIFDPNILAVATGIPEHDTYALDFIRTIKWIKQNLPGAKISGGVSNLSFSFRGNNQVREAMHSVFLYHAIQAGMDMAIVNPSMSVLYEDIDPKLREAVENVILCKGQNATNRLIEIAASYNIKNDKVEQKILWRDLPLVERISYALKHGNTEYVNQDMQEAIAHWPNAVDIIDGPLMDSMNLVGKLFGQGKMFLPQVVKSARTMKAMVNILNPVIEKQNEGGKQSAAAKILLATVKGDVHDIGKNILSIVLTCNNFEVIDLGVMVPGEKIIEEAIKNKVDMISLSGLITPSLEEMCHVASMMEEKGMKIPLMVGGATTSELHTAVKIAPCYSGSVLQAKDASSAARMAYDILSQNSGVNYGETMKQHYQHIRDKYRKEKEMLELRPFASCQKNKYVLDSTYIPPKPFKTGLFPVVPAMVEILPFVNWRSFFAAWKVKELAAAELKEEALSFLQQFGDHFVLKGVTGIFSAWSDGESIYVSDPDNGKFITSLEFFRKQAPEDNVCLSDYIADAQSGKKDYIGAFAASVRYDLTPKDEFEQLLVQSLTDRFAEAMAEYMHFLCRTEWWSYSNEKDDIKEILKGHFQGIRPAPGYPAWPDHQEKKKILNMLDARLHTDITLTDSYSMVPASSVCGIIFSHPKAHYFETGAIGLDQKKNYADRKGVAVSDLVKFGIK